MTANTESDKTNDSLRNKESITFLRELDAEGRHNLVRIHPETGLVIGQTFAPGSWEAIDSWISAHSDENIYYSVNEPRSNARDKKLTKADIESIRAVFVDMDPDKKRPFAEERKRLAELTEQTRNIQAPPSMAVDSGGGYQYVWRLHEKLDMTPENKEWAEKQGRGLAYALGNGDTIQNVDRILRLPGTTNYPDDKKRATGREAAPAHLVRASGSVYTPERLTAYAAPRESVNGDNDQDPVIAAVCEEINEPAARAGMDSALKLRIEADMERSDTLAAIMNGQPIPGDDQSGSAYRWTLAQELAMLGGYSPQDYATVACSVDVTNTNKRAPGGWARQFAREWVRRAQPFAPESYFTVMTPDEAMQIKKASGKRLRELLHYNLTEAADLALSHKTKPLIKGLLDCGTMSVLYGDSNVGKSFVALDMCYHIAEGVPYAGMKTTPGIIVYVAAEGGAGILKRARALRDRFDPEHPERFIIVPEPVDLRSSAADAAAVAQLCVQLEADNAEGLKVVLIIIDTTSRAMAGGDENSSVDFGAYVTNIDKLRSYTSAHVMSIHHTGKDKAKGARGHSLLRAATDTEIEVGEGTIEVMKQRDLDKSWCTGFELTEIQLGVDDDLEPITSVTVDLRAFDDVKKEREAAARAEKDGGFAPGADNPESPTHGLTVLDMAALDALRTLDATDNLGRGASVHDVRDCMGAAGETVALGSIRNIMARLTGRGLAIKTLRGRWTLSAGAAVKLFGGAEVESAGLDIFG